MADNIRKPARARLWKRVAILVASVSTLALVTFVILSFLPHGNDAFSIRIDDSAQKNVEESHFHMSKSWSDDGTKDADAGTFIRGDSLDRVVPAKDGAAGVEKYLTSLDTIEGQQNYAKVEKDADGNDIGNGYALVYTVYLVNDSTTKDQKLKYSVNVDSYYDSSSIPIIDYFRILIQSEIMGSNEVNNVYYGRKHTNVNAPYPNDLPEGTDREPISAYLMGFDLDVIVSDFESHGNDGYCINFEEMSDTNKSIVNGVEIVIPAGKTLRFTYVAYFEGKDMDCNGTIPTNSVIQLSLHFGV